MRSGFSQMYSADESLMNAFYQLGWRVDVPAANNENHGGGSDVRDREDEFAKGLSQLRALQ